MLRCAWVSHSLQETHLQLIFWDGKKVWHVFTDLVLINLLEKVVEKSHFVSFEYAIKNNANEEVIANIVQINLLQSVKSIPIPPITSLWV